MAKSHIDLDKLKEAVWSGVPKRKSGQSIYMILDVPHLRTEAWSLLCDYIPVDQELRSDTLIRKHEEYNDLIKHYFGRIA